ncbi:MAG: hypothetical protein AUK48_05270 [Oscillatoriales cyanobacterium CG2_30_44_21]|nr:MAG: hypothetical protein AUK48_05270 [Oscillatoriales cyanobacterium CG2_30_44_21]
MFILQAELINTNLSMMSFQVTPETTQNKDQLLDYFRQRGEEKLSELRQEIGNQNYKKLAEGVNKSTGEALDTFKLVIINESSKNQWTGEISLQLDLHATIKGTKVNIDFKSGFGSNEKGNTNRLLIVATIYKNLEDKYQNVLLVRAREDLNNHYFRILRDSEVWQAYCGEEAYGKIGDFTGFDLRRWISENIDWDHDLLTQTLHHLSKNNLMGYLEW